MSRLLDLADIQGGILRDYGGNYPKGRYVFIEFRRAQDGDAPEKVREIQAQARGLIHALRARVTSALRWESKALYYQGPVEAAKPPVTINVAFTFHGLRALGLPIRTLQRLPDEFINGMIQRASVLGDVGRNAPERWDRAWKRGGSEIHLAVMMRAMMRETDGTPVPELDATTDWLRAKCREHEAVFVEGHRETPLPGRVGAPDPEGGQVGAGV